MFKSLEKISKYDKQRIKDYSKVSYIVPSKNLFVKERANSKLNPYNLELTRAEISLFLRLEEIGERIVLIRENKSTATNDFIWRGKAWELKTVVKDSNNSIRNAIWRATSQKKRNIVLDLTYLRRDFGDCLLNILDLVSTISGIDNLVAIRRDKIVRVK